jgi:peptidase M48-like protein
MDQAGAASNKGNIGIEPPQPKRCPLCSATVAPDPLGLYLCACGWGGPGDPLEHDRGLAKLVTKIDRSLADGQAHRDLRRLATRGDSASSLNYLYLALLLLIATVTYVVVLAITVLCLWLIVSTILDRTWIGAIVGGIILALIIGSLWPQRRNRKSVLVTRERFPALVAALDEVSQRVGVRIPKRVVLTPGDEFDIMRMIRGGEILRIGAANLPLLSDVELKSLLTHELAHAHKGYTALHRYSVQAEDLLHEFVYGILEGVAGQSHWAMPSRRRYIRRYRYSGDSATVAVLGLAFTWTVMLPFRVLWSGYHLLRLHESRMAEFAADRAAIHAYGPQAFINGLTGLLVSRRTLAKSWASLRSEMLRHNSQNFYAEMRRHYSELPPHVVSQLRVDVSTGFRTLAQSHPTTPDRLRAAYATFDTLAPSPASVMPAYMLFATAGASDADAIERELTTLFFNPKKK